ncbi:LuxR C-terminal-related transcriptional regulator [Patulibacter sp. NPDC049589]|uniref:LuxR C-terminal-related transcriptional regulator n=1 Tax=Patulibacter sp. NPDC049589 TaxID=3154731 RepID=UPI00344A8149
MSTRAVAGVRRGFVGARRGRAAPGATGLLGNAGEPPVDELPGADERPDDELPSADERPEPDEPVDPRAIDETVRALARERADARSMRRTLPESLRAQVGEALRTVQAAMQGSEDVARWAACHGRLLDERRAIDAHDAAVRVEVRQAVRDAAAELRASGSAATIAARAARIGCHAGGFSRVLVSAVHGSRWLPLAAHSDAAIDPDPEALQAFVAGGEAIPLGNHLAETDLVRRRTSFRSPGVLLGRRRRPPAAADVAGHVAAPIVLGDEVVGIVHADRAGQRRGVTEDDRILLAAFARVVAQDIDRVSAQELLDRRTRRLEIALERARGELRQARAPAFDRAPRLADVGRPGDRGSAPAGRDVLLTAREREIIELVAQGATNSVVAQRLTVSEETVKSHMRTILRKLHVKSRSAAVARFRRIAQDLDE